MPAPYKTFRALRSKIAPRWLTEGEGGLVGYALDLMRDALLERVRLGMLARFPQQDANGTPGPADALTSMGRDRRMVRGLDETDTTYAARMKDWLTDRRTAGNPYTLMKQLHAYTGTAHGVSFRTVDNSGNWYSRSSAGVETASINLDNWDWDTDTGVRWARFWVIIYAGTLWEAEPFDWGDGDDPDWGDDPATEGFGSTATQDHVRTLQAIVADWKPAGTRCNHIILAFDPASFDPATPEPDGEWGNWHKIVAGESVPSRLDTARYINGS